MNKLKVRIVNLLVQYDLLNLKQDIDWEKFNHYAIVHHSTSIEGASLSVHDTMALLGEGLTAKGKPLVHHLMQTDHPFADGNGRVSRLIMNYIQHFYQLPLAIVFKEDKSAYYKALTDSRDKEDIDIFRHFMYKQYEKMLLLEIRKAQKSKSATIKSGDHGKSNSLSMIF